MEKPGRNDPCWCGSGKKYKKCHIDFDEKIEEFEGAGHIVPSHEILKNAEQIEKIKGGGEKASGARKSAPSAFLSPLTLHGRVRSGAYYPLWRCHNPSQRGRNHV